MVSLLSGTFINNRQKYSGGTSVDICSRYFGVFFWKFTALSTEVKNFLHNRLKVDELTEQKQSPNIAFLCSISCKRPVGSLSV